VIVGHLHLEAIAILPYETQAILIIDPYAVLALAITFEGFKPIPWRYLKFVQDPYIV
jgi:hypothetical protein